MTELERQLGEALRRFTDISCAWKGSRFKSCAGKGIKPCRQCQANSALGAYYLALSGDALACKTCGGSHGYVETNGLRFPACCVSVAPPDADLASSAPASSRLDGETRPICGELFETEDGLTCKCDRIKDHKGDCYGETQDLDLEPYAAPPPGDATRRGT